VRRRRGHGDGRADRVRRADPYGGGSESGLAGVNPHVERRAAAPRRPARGPLRPARLALLLRPAADALLATGAPEAAASGVPLAEALPAFWDALAVDA